jgi:Fic family protein
VVLATHAKAYVKGLTDFRRGAIEDWCDLFTRATQVSVDGATRLIGAFSVLQNEWLERLVQSQNRAPRRESTAVRVIAELPGIPILDAATIQRILHVSHVSANHAIAQLEAAGILQRLTEGAHRNRRWAASEVFGLIDGFEWELGTPSPKFGAKESRRPTPSPTRKSRERLV